MLPVSKWMRTCSLPKWSSKGVHFHRRHEVAVEEDVLDVEDLQFLGLLRQFADRLPGALIANVVGHRFVIGAPGNVDRPGDDEHIFHTEIVRRLRNLACEPEPCARLAGSLLVSGYGQKRNEQSPLTRMPIWSARRRMFLGTPCAGLRRKIVLQIVVELDAVEARVLGELQALAQVHPLRVRKRPLVDRLEHRVTLRRAAPRIGRRRLRGARGLEGEGGKADARNGGFEGIAAGDAGGSRVHRGRCGGEVRPAPSLQSRRGQGSDEFRASPRPFGDSNT